MRFGFAAGQAVAGGEWGRVSSSAADSSVLADME